MATKGGSESIKTAEQQNEVRRAIKQARRARQRAGQMSVPAEGTDLLSQVREDRVAARETATVAAQEHINQQGLAWLDGLDPFMCSPSPTVHGELRGALVVFVGAFIGVNETELRIQRQSRRAYAIGQAHAHLSSEPARTYFSLKVKQVASAIAA